MSTAPRRRPTAQLLAAIAVLSYAATASADLLVPVTFATDNGGTNKPKNISEFVIENITGLDGIPSFDVTLTITGSGDLHSNANLLAVKDNTNDLVDNGDSLQFTIVTSNPAVQFDGFSEITFASNSASGTVNSVETGVLSITADSNNAFDFDDLLPKTFTAVGDATGFAVTSVTGQFSLAAVPEPTAFLFGSLVAGVVGTVVTRRRPARA